MTRINVVPVEELTNKHLLAEYRELPRIMRLVRPCADAPQNYTLGKGHLKFFYNKMSFIVDRFHALVAECKKRGFNVQHEHLPVRKTIPSGVWNNYTPTPEALALNRARIAERLKEAAV
jgi:hypothetical protein